LKAQGKTDPQPTLDVSLNNSPLLGIDRTQFIYYSGLQPWLSYWGVFWTALFILINGFAVFFKFNPSDFVTACMYSLLLSRVLPTHLYYPDINIPIFFLLFVGWKIYKKTKFWKADDMDFVTGIPSVAETEAPEVPPRNLGEKIANILF
jgi:amino acid transporter